MATASKTTAMMPDTWVCDQCHFHNLRTPLKQCKAAHRTLSTASYGAQTLYTHKGYTNQTSTVCSLRYHHDDIQARPYCQFLSKNSSAQEYECRGTPICICPYTTYQQCAKIHCIHNMDVGCSLKAHPQLSKVLKHLEYIWYGCGMHFK